MLFERTFEEILSEAINDISSNSRIRNLSPGSLTRAILEAYSRHVNEAYQTFDLNLARSFVSASNGRFLDFIGELLGLQRLGTEAGGASDTSKSVRFFVESGTFGDINSSSDILVNAGTIISSQDTESTQAIRYRTVNDNNLPALATELFITVEALLPGEDQNVAADLLQFHDHTTYTDSLNNTLKVTNPGGIFTGRDLESDTNFRFRITHQVTAAESGNLTAIRLAALSVPGVADILLTQYVRGIGTYDVLIKSITPSVSSSLIDSVQAGINLVTSQGNNGLSRAPLETGITFVISIRYRTDLEANVKSSIEERIAENLTSYVNGLDISDEFIINEAVQRVLEVDDRIKDIGIPTKPFDQLTLFKETKLQDNKIKQTLLENYNTDDDERLIIEPSESNPITFIRVN